MNGRSTKGRATNRDHQLRIYYDSYNDHEETMRTSGKDLKGCVGQNNMPNQVYIELVGEERGDAIVEEKVGMEKQREGEGVKCRQVQYGSQISDGESWN
ncbi:MAG: hypothetical protein EZS28_016152 [Streblomastix strix]|uniref:Uncharacterized protein n=1 Tax=Streblomastix strix TaxID=222440 RepID=A0A5J4W1B1_9EUKA|nr:MAG: hypothetical protein EZS28_016152 [Streblomastix strix]